MTIDDLYRIIGRQAVAIEQLQQEKAALLAANQSLAQKVAELTREAPPSTEAGG